MKRMVWLIPLLLCLHVAHAQEVPPKPDYTITWHHGVVINANQQIIRGEILFNQKEEILLVRKDGATTAFPAQQILFVQYYDDNLQLNREFTTLPDSKNPRRTLFYEVILKGDIVLLRRESEAYEPSRTHQGNEIITSFTPTLKHDYYVYDHQQVRFLTSFRRDVKPLVNHRWGDIEAFIEQQRLSVAEIEDQIDIIHFYNSISN